MAVEISESLLDEVYTVLEEYIDAIKDDEVPETADDRNVQRVLNRLENETGLTANREDRM